MSRHTYLRNQKYSTKDLDDDYYEEDYGSYGSPMSPSAQQYIYSHRNNAVPIEEEETDDEAISNCVNTIYQVIGKHNVQMTRDELADLIRDYNYSSEAVVNHLTNLPGKKSHNDYDDDVFEMDMGSTKVAPPPGFAAKGPSSLAKHLDSHPAVPKKAITGGPTLDELAHHDGEELPDDVTPFDFSEPSPDDFVLGKQKQAFRKVKDNAESKPVTPKTAGTPSSAKPKVSVTPFGGTSKPKLNIGRPSPAASPSKTSPSGSMELSKEMGKLSVSGETPLKLSSSGELKIPSSSKKAIPKQMPDVKRAKTLKELKEGKQDKANISMVVIGHVDAGKSTLMGHLLLKLGFVAKSVIDKFEHEARQRGKASFHFAWVLDQHDEERERGVTVDVATSYFETPKYQVTLLDAPGHKDFVPNMITGASQADVGILVVPAPAGEFDKGFGDNGQTKEHALLARSLGVGQLIVAVNKMDSVGWDQARFESVKEQLAPFLKKTGFKDDSISFVPVSGMTGENINQQTVAELLAWYHGPTLAERIDLFVTPERDVDKPFRLTVNDVYKDGGLAIGGKVETGFVTTGDKLMLMPGQEICTVKTIRFNGQAVEVAAAGFNVDIVLQGVEQNAIAVGSVLCDPEQPIPTTKKIKAQILTFTLDIPLMRGHRVMLHYQNMNEPARLVQLLGILDKNAEIKTKKPRCLGERVSALVEIETDHPICVELYSSIRPLGRFMLRQEGRTVAAGIITELL